MRKLTISIPATAAMFLSFLLAMTVAGETQSIENGVGVICGIKRFNRPFSSALSFSILPFAVGHLQPRGITQDQGSHVECGCRS